MELIDETWELKNLAHYLNAKGTNVILSRVMVLLGKDAHIKLSDAG
jgi:hypothetical protein